MRTHCCLLLTLMLFSMVSSAEVFKCQTTSGKTMYQTSPCSPATARQRVLDVKQRTPEEQENAKTKLRSWQEQQSLEEAARLQAARERQLEHERQESLALQRRSVIAQEQQAIAAQRQNQYRPGGFGYPYYSPCTGSSWNNYNWQDRYRPECDPRYRQYSPLPPNYFPPHTPGYVRPQEPPPRPWPGQPMGTGPVPAPNNPPKPSLFAPGR